jgi:hypothetical protein
MSGYLGAQSVAVDPTFSSDRMWVDLSRCSRGLPVSGELVSLADLIYQLRGDLYKAAWQGESKDPKFVVGPVELELSVVVDSSRSAGAHAALWVVDASAASQKSTQTTHRIKLTLQPVGPDGQPSKISGATEVGEE